MRGGRTPGGVSAGGEGGDFEKVGLAPPAFVPPAHQAAVSFRSTAMERCSEPDTPFANAKVAPRPTMRSSPLERGAKRVEPPSPGSCANPLDTRITPANTSPGDGHRFMAGSRIRRQIHGCRLMPHTREAGPLFLRSARIQFDHDDSVFHPGGIGVGTPFVRGQRLSGFQIDFPIV